VAATRIIGKAEQEKLLAALLAAGVKGHGHLATLVAAKMCSATAFVPLCWLILDWRDFLVGSTGARLLLLTGALILGWRCPEVMLSRLAARRRARLETGIPDALDLLVICAEAGLSLDQAIAQVGRVLRSSSPEVASEFIATAAEMRVSAERSQALENLAHRAGIASLRGIVATLNQSLKFGTPLARSLRVLAAEMRADRLARFEERAARLPVLLTLPLMAFIMPSLLLVIGTPLALRILDMLGRGP
jgi:tight adherence protein C